jgi:hypothetical protein
MQSIEFVPSPDDPSPNIAELVDSALRLSIQTTDHESVSPETEPLTLHAYDGTVILHRLLPDLPIDALWALRDAISEQDTPQEPSIEVAPATLFGGWVKKLRSFLTAPHPESVPPETVPAAEIEILTPIEGRTKQAHIKTSPENHAVIVRRSSFSGSVMIDGLLYEFDPSNTILEVGQVSYDLATDDTSEQFARKQRRHYTLVSGTGDLYKSKQYGGSLSDVKVEDEAVRRKALKKIAAILEEVHATPQPTAW